LRRRNNDELLSLCPPKLTAEYPTPLTPAESKIAIEEVIETLDLISVAFMWPDHLDFLHTSLGSIPDLADTRQNAAWIQQQERLLGLATELQYIPTYGSASLQKAHAEATGLVEKELCELDAFKSRLWEKPYTEDESPPVRVRKRGLITDRSRDARMMAIHSSGTGGAAR
ncbi:hypothetical protein FRC09_004965, partial [Ceratobasidium sp. 395]